MNITNVKRIKFYNSDGTEDNSWVNITSSDGDGGTTGYPNGRYDDEIKAWVDAGNTIQSVDTPSLTWDDIRADRDQRLVETDWTQTPDIPQETIWKWKTYRQDLRDIPQKQTDPTNITWPTKPS